MNKFYLILLGLIIAPLTVNALTLGGLIYNAIYLLNLLVPLIVALALVAFLYGVAQFIMNAADATKREEGKKVMIWGIIGLFVMISVWGLVRVLQNTVGVSGGSGGNGNPSGIQGNVPWGNRGGSVNVGNRTVNVPVGNKGGVIQIPF